MWKMVFLLPRKNSTCKKEFKVNKLFQRYNPEPSKVYKGIRFDDGSRRGRCLVLGIDDAPLYSALLDGEDQTNLYEWGYRGSFWGERISLPKNLTYSILCDHLETSDYPDELAYMFHTFFTACLPFENWILDSNTIDAWIEYISQEYLQ